MNRKEQRNIKTLLKSEDLDIVKQGLVLWESLITDFDTFHQDLKKLSGRRNPFIYNKETLFAFRQQLEIYDNFHCVSYLSVWTLGVLSQFEEMKPQVLSCTSLNITSLGLTEFPDWLQRIENLERLSRF